MMGTITESAPKHHPPALRLACRRAYVHGEGSLPQIAQKHGLKTGTVHRWSIEEGWGQLRDSWLEQQMRKDELVSEPIQTAPNPAQLTDYVALRIARVREQLDRLDELMATESDPNKLDRLASAQTRLSEQERIMSGRPLPGSRRPGKEKPPERPRIEPLE